MPPLPSSHLVNLCRDRGLYWISPCIAQGGYPEGQDFPLLRQAGVTHLLNLDRQYTDETGVQRHGFTELIWFPIVDFQRIPEPKALNCLDRLHAVLVRDESRIYVHCYAGMNRSPTILWLYFVACGLAQEQATNLIQDASPAAVAPTPALYDQRLLAAVMEHGLRRFQPLARPEIVQAIAGSRHGA